MKHIKLFFVVFLFISSLQAKLNLTTEETAYVNSTKIKVGVLGDFPPFSTYQNNIIKGYSHDILQLISQKTGLKFVYKVNKWNKNLKKFKEKKLDIIDSISYDKMHASYTKFSKPYYKIPLVIFSRKDLYGFDGSLESLKGKRFGINKNSFYKKQIQKLNLFKVKEYNSFDDEIRALAFGEVDFIFGYLLRTQTAIKNSKFTNMKALGELQLPNLKKIDLRFGIRKDKKLLISIFNKAYDSITLKQWADLYAKWISIYYEKEQQKIIDLSTKEREFLISKHINCVVPKNWMPFHFIEKGELTGLSVDYWNLIKTKTLINSKCKAVKNFQVAMNLIKEKKADLSIATAISDQKKKFALFSKPYISFPIAIATTLDKRYISNISSLKDKKVAVGKAYSSYYILKKKFPNIKFVQVEDDYQGLELLSKGEVFAVVDILPVISHMIGEYGFKNIKISGITDFNFDVRFIVRKDYSTLVPIINKGIDLITKNELNKIKNKWLSVKFEELVDYTRVWQIGSVIFLIICVLIYRQNILNKHNKKLHEVNNEIEIKTKELEKKTIELAKQKELFEKIYYESSDGILLMELSSKNIVDCNDVASSLLGYKKEEFVLLNILDTLPLYQFDGSSTTDHLSQFLLEALDKGSNLFEMVHIRKDKTLVWFEVVLTPIIIEEKEVIHIVWRDIQARKEMEKELNILTNSLEEKVKNEVKKNEEKTKQLLQQSRLAQMGEMISMIAHQWRQPLTAISATTNNLLIRMMIKEKIEEKELKDEITLISEYSQHLSMTIDDFRNFFKPDKEKVDTSLEEIILNSINIVKKSLDANNIILEKSFECNIKLKLFASEVSQVILNLIKNAEDAISEKYVKAGKITIKTYLENDSSFASVEISDNAGGIASEIIDKIFDPYFSTKKKKEGTGLGLYMSKIIINDHSKGTLSVYNGIDGAVFKIKIPIDNEI